MISAIGLGKSILILARAEREKQMNCILSSSKDFISSLEDAYEQILSFDQFFDTFL
jgi:hypothetical protein